MDLLTYAYLELSSCLSHPCRVDVPLFTSFTFVLVPSLPISLQLFSGPWCLIAFIRCLTFGICVRDILSVYACRSYYFRNADSFVQSGYHTACPSAHGPDFISKQNWPPPQMPQQKGHTQRFGISLPIASVIQMLNWTHRDLNRVADNVQPTFSAEVSWSGSFQFQTWSIDIFP